MTYHLSGIPLLVVILLSVKIQLHTSDGSMHKWKAK